MAALATTDPGTFSPSVIAQLMASLQGTTGIAPASQAQVASDTGQGPSTPPPGSVLGALTTNPPPQAPAPVNAPPMAPDPNAAPPGGPAQGATEAPQAPALYKPSFIETLMSHKPGMSWQEAQDSARARHYVMANLPAQQAWLATLPPDERAAYMANPSGWSSEYSKNFGPQNIAGGNSVQYEGPQGPMVTAPKSFSDTTNGVVGFVGPNGQITGSGYPTIQTAKPGETISPLAPVALGAPPSVGTAASGPSAPAPVGSMVAAANGAVPSVDAPRGIRNANPGNLTALPNGQQWDGQIGVDPQGYVKFATPQAGIAAALKNLHSYATKDGINTVAALVARWAPQGAGNNVQAYANYVASALGVKPTDKIDLTNPQIASAAANAIFAYENGPKAWAAHSGAATPVVPVATANTGAYPATLQGGKVSPATYDPHLDAYTQTEPGGKQDVVEANPFGVKQQLEYTTNFINTPQYKDYDQLSRFYDTAQQALQRQGGPADLQLIDMAIKANNPTLGARPNQVDQAINEIGPLNMWGGQIKAVVDNGQRLSPAARQAMVNVVADARNAAWRGLQPLVAKADRDAKKMGLTRDDLLPGLTPPTSPPTSSGFGPDHPQLAPTGAPDKFAATYAALPSGARYQAPDGSWRVKR